MNKIIYIAIALYGILIIIISTFFAEKGFEYSDVRMLTAIVGISIIAVPFLGMYIWFKFQEEKYYSNNSTKNINK